ncbi:MAG: glycogen synthase GlgA [Enterobacteriaceae bacterium]
MRVLHVCTEMYPLLKTGGLADVIGALPAAQNEAGIDARILMPAFPAYLEHFKETSVVKHLHTFAGPMTLRYTHYNGVPIYLIDAPQLYNRPGSPYHDYFHVAYADNHLRFALLGWVACEMACGLDHYWRPELVHAHDWHAGLACAYLAMRWHPARSLFTVHNLAYQGLFAAQHLSEIGLPENFMQPYGLEFHGQISYLKAGLYYADHITTVSPTYAREITQPAFACGMEGLLQERFHHWRLSGILNGVDDTIWDPQTDERLVSTYNIRQLKKKSFNKADLQIAMGLKVDAKKLLFSVVSRLTEQKGLDMILDVLPSIIKQDGQLVILGNGDPELEARFRDIAALHPGSVGVLIGYDEDLSHRIIAGADVILLPSRFEPCGLTQLYGLKYGTLPLVRHTGGLADTVVDCSLENLEDRSATGFVFYSNRIKDLEAAIRRAFTLWARPKLWHRVQQNAMQKNFSWHVAAEAYHNLYQHLL